MTFEREKEGKKGLFKCRGTLLNYRYFHCDALQVSRFYCASVVQVHLEAIRSLAKAKATIAKALVLKADTLGEIAKAVPPPKWYNTAHLTKPQVQNPPMAELALLDRSMRPNSSLTGLASEPQAPETTAPGRKHGANLSPLKDRAPPV